MSHAIHWRVWALCGLLLLGSMAGGCVPKGKKGEVLAPRGQLVFRARTFNRFLRWKSFDRAKQLVAPKQRAAFMLEWERNRNHIRITDFRVRDVTETKKGRKAVVLVVIHRHKLPSVSVQRVLEQQRWESKNGYWYFVGIKPDDKTKKTGKKAPSDTKKQPSSQPKKPS